MNNFYNPVRSISFNDKFQAPLLSDSLKDEDTYNKIKDTYNASAQMVVDLCQAIDNNGIMPDGTKISLKDVAVTSSQIAEFVPAVVETYIRESMEPYSNVAQLFDDIPMPKPVEINIKTFGSFDVAEVGEGGTVPMRIFDITGAGERLTLGFKKYGAGVGLTKEAIDADNWGFLRYWLNQASKAFARNRERKAMSALELKAQTLIDNNGTSLIGPTTGRGISGAFNGTLAPGDLARAIAYGLIRDIHFDTVLMNPMAWIMFKLYFTGTTALPKSVKNYLPQRGSAAPGWPSSPNKFYKEAPGAYGNPGMANNPIGLLSGMYASNYQLAMYGATFENDIFDVDSPLNIIISPWVPYKVISAGDAKDKYFTNLYLIDSSNVGAFFTKYGPTITEWDDKSTDNTYWKVLESFGLGIYNRGIGIGAIRNIVIDNQYDFNMTYNISTAPAEYPAYTPGNTPDELFTGLFS